MFQYDVASIKVAEVCQPFDKPAKIRTFFLGAPRVPQHSYSRIFCCLLRERCLRPTAAAQPRSLMNARRCICPRTTLAMLKPSTCDRALGKQFAEVVRRNGL